MTTNLLLLLTVATLHWEPSPDTSVVRYAVYASPSSRYTNQLQLTESNPPPPPPGATNISGPLLVGRSVCIGTNANWQAQAVPVGAVTNQPFFPGTNWAIPPSLDNVRLYYAVTAIDGAGAESDLSNEVLFAPRWVWVGFAVDSSADLTNWTALGVTNLWRVWAPHVGQRFFRGRMVTRP